MRDYKDNCGFIKTKMTKVRISQLDITNEPCFDHVKKYSG